MVESPVDRMYSEYRDILGLMDHQREPSVVSALNDTFRKSLLLCAASYFERQITQGVLEFVREKSHPTDLIAFLVHNKAIARQYHSWFDWDNSRNANKFFSLFGQRFKSCMDRHIASEQQLRGSIAAFMEIGRDRNRLVHEDFGTFVLEKTAEEIYQSYQTANEFVETMPNCLRRFEV